MTISQDARTPVSPPVADVRDGAALTGEATRTGAAGLAAPPVASPARSTEQTCTRCRRSGAIKVTVNVGDRRWRFCALCVDRAEKTTAVRPVTCSHPYSRARNGGYVCLDCYEPVPGPARCADDDQHAAECQLCAEAGRASVAAVVSIGLYGVVMAGLAGATGKLVGALPITPTPNGFSLLVILLLVAGCLWLRRVENPKLEKWPAGAEPLADATWPDLHPDDAHPTLLPTDPKQVRS